MKPYFGGQFPVMTELEVLVCWVFSFPVSNTRRERKEGHEICRQIDKGALNKGSPTIFGKTHHFPTSQ
jgi:hypothetical protein